MIALKMITIGLVGNQMTKNKLIKANKVNTSLVPNFQRNPMTKFVAASDIK